jgi:hypothetical protein
MGALDTFPGLKSPAPAPGPAPSKDLASWQIALIIIGAILCVILSAYLAMSSM